jgi:hypothetical protein
LFSQRLIQYYTRFFGQRLVILPQAEAQTITDNPRSLVLIYPRQDGMVAPVVTSRLKAGLPAAEIRWDNNIMDVVGVGSSDRPALSITRHYSDGSQDILTTVSKE